MHPWWGISTITPTAWAVSWHVYIMVGRHRIIETPDRKIPNADARSNYKERHKIWPELSQFLFGWTSLIDFCFLIHWSLLIFNRICIILKLLILDWLSLRLRLRSLDLLLYIFSYFLRRLILLWLFGAFSFVRRLRLILINYTFFLLWFNFFLHWFWFR